MKIIYDIAILGIGHYDFTNRAGIFRVTENIVKDLACSDKCELMLSATQPLGFFQTLNNCIGYLAAENSFLGTPLVHSKIKQKLYTKLIEFNVVYSDKKRFSSIYHKTLKTVLNTANNIIDLYNRNQYFIENKYLEHADIYHSPIFAIPQQVRQEKQIETFLTIYDLIPILYPEYFDIPYNDDHFIKKIIDQIQPNDWIICISHSTKSDLCNYVDIDPSRVFVTHLAASDSFYLSTDTNKVYSIKSKYGIHDRPYILSLNTLEPRKNIDQLVRAFAKLVQQERIDDLCLVLVGAKGWKFDKIFEEIENFGFLKKRIILTGYVADEDLAPLYSGAMMFVYPSLYEGFGLPPLEAMQCGVPVITSNTSSLPEVVGDAGIMVDPLDSDTLCQNMLNLYQHSSLRESMSLKSVERAKLFSWQKCAQETIRAYQTSLS